MDAKTEIAIALRSTGGRGVTAEELVPLVSYKQETIRKVLLRLQREGLAKIIRRTGKGASNVYVPLSTEIPIALVTEAPKRTFALTPDLVRIARALFIARDQLIRIQCLMRDKCALTMPLMDIEAATKSALAAIEEVSNDR